MFRAAVRLSVSGARSLTWTRLGCTGILVFYYFYVQMSSFRTRFTWCFGRKSGSVLALGMISEIHLLERVLRMAVTPLVKAICVYLLSPQDKSGPHKDIYPYLIQELRPTLDELGISTPEELGMDKL
uniref:Cytochrome c oxidase subunit 5A, mitochondrial n=1 Tax=Oncorhynchus mykiss TaxID=8022 RepID=A0A8K9WZF0_ONCMY